MVVLSDKCKSIVNIAGKSPIKILLFSPVFFFFSFLFFLFIEQRNQENDEVVFLLLKIIVISLGFKDVRFAIENLFSLFLCLFVCFALNSNGYYNTAVRSYYTIPTYLLFLKQNHIQNSKS